MKRRRRAVTVVTTGRADYGPLRPVVRALLREPTLRTRLLVTGAHLSSRLGSTMRAIEQDGFATIADRVPMLVKSAEPGGIAKSMGTGVTRIAAMFARRRPDVLVVLGDRFETLAAVTAALPFNIIVAHIHGGERSEGAIDEAIRHAVTKMSHLHFVSTRAHGARVRQMGEDAWRITVSGAPALDALRGFRPTAAAELADVLGVPIGRATLLVTYHPETLESDQGRAHLAALLRALDRIDSPVVFTAPNADTAGDVFHAAMVGAASTRADRIVAASLGQQRYFSLMAHAGAMVGNSSSGIIEAPSFNLPVVNIGGRQQGRQRAPNVIDVPARAGAIEAAIRRALRPSFRRSLVGRRNPYRSANASASIARRLATVPIDRRLLVKVFVDR